MEGTRIDTVVCTSCWHIQFGVSLGLMCSCFYGANLFSKEGVLKMTAPSSFLRHSIVLPLCFWTFFSVSSSLASFQGCIFSLSC